MASEQQRARQLALAARACIGEEPGISVTPEGTRHGWRVLISPNRAWPDKDYARGCDRLLEHRLPLSSEVIYVTRDEWRNLLECALDEVAKREEDAAQTAEHTTPNLAPPAIFAPCGTRIKRTYDGIGEVSDVATVPNPNLPPPDCVPQPVLDAVGGLGLNVIGVPRLSVIKGGNA